MTGEAVGQRSGAMNAQLVAREVQARRDEISQTLAQMGSMLSDEERLALQRELGLMDSMIRQQLGNADVSLRGQQLGLQGQQLDLEKALGMGRLGLDAEQQSTYWDWLKQGGRMSN